jgi:tetratricopeptide (TPR) repeat protein
MLFPIYDELEKRYGKSTEPEIQVQVAKAMLKKGVALFELRRYDEARKVFEKADKLGDPEARRALELMNRLGE